MSCFFFLYFLFPSVIVAGIIFIQLGRVKRIWYLSPIRAAKVQASLRIRAVSPEPPCSLKQAGSQEEPSDRKPDPWPLRMSGHAQLKFVMTECSKTQIRLTWLSYCLLSALMLWYMTKHILKLYS